MGADRYLEVGFTPGAGTLAAGTSTGPVSVGFHAVDWAPLDVANDYSYNGWANGLVDWPKVTLYQNGILFWGTEPQ